MNAIKGRTVIVPQFKPKYDNAATGDFVVSYGCLYFRSGKEIVFIREHFADKNVPILDLVERTVLFDKGNGRANSGTSGGTEHYDSTNGGAKILLENGDKPCYNDIVNDVL